MPKVTRGGKTRHFAYTKAGKAAAKRYARKTRKKVKRKKSYTSAY